MLEYTLFNVYKYSPAFRVAFVSTGRTFTIRKTWIFGSNFRHSEDSINAIIETMDT